MISVVYLLFMLKYAQVLSVFISQCRVGPLVESKPHSKSSSSTLNISSALKFPSYFHYRSRKLANVTRAVCLIFL